MAKLAGTQTEYDTATLREYALTNMKAVLVGLRTYDRQSIPADRAKAVSASVGWRHDRLEAAARWAQIAEALREDPK